MIKKALHTIVIVIFILLFVVSGLVLTHPYVVEAIKTVLSSAFSNWFRQSPMDEFNKVSGHELAETKEDSPKYRIPIFTEETLSFAEVTNAVTLVSILIDARSECAMLCLRKDIDVKKINPSLPFHYIEWFNRVELNRSKIKKQVAELFDEEKDKRDSAIKRLFFDIKRTRLNYKNLSHKGWTTVEYSWKRWGVEIKTPGYPVYGEAGEFQSLSEEERLLSALISSHFKAILYEEIKTILFERTGSSWLQYLEETEALN